MKSIWSRIAKIAYAAVLLAATATLFLRVGGGVQSDVMALAGDAFGEDLRSIAETSSKNARVMLSGTNRADVIAGARMVRDSFGVGQAPDKSFLDSFRGRTDGLLDDESRSLILSGKTSEVRETAEARLFGITPPLFSVKEDPMLLASGFVESLTGFLAPGWAVHDGMPVKMCDGVTHALVPLSFEGTAPRGITSAMKRIREALPGGVRASFSGAVFHAAVSAVRAEKETGFLSAVSLVLVLFLGWRLFRSFRFVLPLLLALSAGCLVATAALFAVWERPHVLTFVFGTSLIGLSVDYVYHVRASGGAKNVIRPLTQSFVTTLVSFAPLLLADVPVLRQMALFTATGLAGVYAYTVIFSWAGTAVKEIAHDNRLEVKSSFFFNRFARVLLLLSAGCGLFFVRSSSDPSVFYRPDRALAADEKAVAENLSMENARIVHVRGSTLQEALEREERSGIPFGLSKVLPSLERQRENASLKASLYATEGAAYAENTGLKKPLPPAEPKFLDPLKLHPQSALGAMVAAMWTGQGLMTPCPADFSCDDSDVRTVDMRKAVESSFARLTQYALRLFLVSAGILIPLLVIFFRSRFFSYAAPVAATFIATAGMMGWLGIPFTFFTALSFFVLTGLGLDYAIFHRGPDARTAERTVLFAFLTSFTGLGMLAFTAFPVTRDMGIVFAFGLFFAYVFSVRRK